MNIKKELAAFTFFQKTIVLTIVFFLLFSSIFYIFKRQGNRYVLLYESMDANSLYTETTWMPVSSPLSIEEFICQESILGPKTDRYRPLFQYGVDLLYCYKNGSTVYINLSEKAAIQKGKTSNTKQAWKIMQKNIKRLVRGVEKVTFFIAGQEVSEKSFAKTNDLLK